ncbi:CDP-glycerol glycerophosphotransferase family protein [Pseudothioclava nitratireducens]|uniref:CDP-glycerol glycerophosphotransferase family protein n=1 Tax=Pseudothioclava nitratireducens TaxID=1928646 RepID=UPI0023DCE02F|nr:CDP-glycerol glycerophosphotransferase family protein [Defluviimonas nitratireducens]MDF1621706.1 CDP-glycerol glycerophosphotransferase family protein [Defluviimonas nitratireducens]
MVKQLAAGPLLLILFLFASTIPRNNTRMVFASWYGKKYGDSTKYLFEEAQKRPKYDAYFLVKDKALLETENPAILYAYSAKGIWAQLTARYFFCTVNSFDFFAPCIGRNAELVQVCHGMPIKRGFEEKYGWFSKLKNAIRRNTIDRYRYVVSAHKVFDEILRTQWRVKQDQLLTLPMPRCDALFDTPKAFAPDWLDGSKKFVLYAPTHRDEGHSIDAILENCKLIAEFFSTPDKIALGYVPAVKLHYYDEKFADQIESECNLHVLVADLDTNVILSRVDILLADYSGIVYDYSYLKRPIICLAADYQTYTRRHRGLYFELGDLFRHIAYDKGDLHRILSAACSTEGIAPGLKIDLSPEGCEIGQFSQYSFDVLEDEVFQH